jgi:perosamine synthetase
MTARRIRYPVAEPILGDAEIKAVSRCIAGGWISSLSPDIGKFEREFSSFCGTRHGVTVSTGTAALHLALVAHGIGKGDEVIVPDMTFVATANAVAYTGATVVTADVDAGTWNIDPRSVADRITRRTRAIIPVHLFGFPADMKTIRRMAGRRIHVIEDAAESHGATLDGRMTGCLGEMGCFSFYANKTITTGEGGFITLDDPDLAARLRFLRDHAMDPARRYFHPEIGYNYRLTGIQAALGRAQLRRIRRILKQKRRNAALYRARLDGIPGLAFQEPINGAVSSEWMFSILLPPKTDRDEVARLLRARGVDSRPFFHPISHLPMYRKSRHPISTELHRRGLTLPSSALLAPKDIDFIAEQVRAVLVAKRG